MFSAGCPKTVSPYVNKNNPGNVYSSEKSWKILETYEAFFIYSGLDRVNVFRTDGSARKILCLNIFTCNLFAYFPHFTIFYYVEQISNLSFRLKRRLLMGILLRQWLLNTQFCRIKGCGGAGCPPSPPIIFERLKLPQQIIYRRKGNLSESPNHQKYWENILISRFYEQFSRSIRILGHFWKFQKISDS